MYSDTECLFNSMVQRLYCALWKQITCILYGARIWFLDRFAHFTILVNERSCAVKWNEIRRTYK